MKYCWRITSRNSLEKIAMAKNVLSIFSIIVIWCSFFATQNCYANQKSPTDRLATGMVNDSNAIFSLEVDRKTHTLVDRTDTFNTNIHGGIFFDDPSLGPCIRFGSGTINGISISDEGKIRFEDGFTLEMLVYLEEQPKEGTLAIKIGSFCFTIKNSKLNNAWMVFPREQVATDNDQQYKYYPVDSQTFFGSTPIPTGRWVQLAITYDQTMKVIRTWVDGGIDRTRYLPLEGDAPLILDPSKAIEFVKGMENIRIATIKLSKGVQQIGEIPAMETYVHQLPYGKRLVVTIDHIDRKQSLPIDVTILCEDPGGVTRTLKYITLTSYERGDIQIDAPLSWKGALSTLSIKAYSDRRMIYSRSVRIANPSPAKTIWINTDKSLSIDGKKIFPLLIYHAFPEDYRLLAEMGFNIIMPRGLGLKFMGTGGSDAKDITDIKTCLDEAHKSNVYLFLGGNTVFGNLNGISLFKDHPALLAWAGFDEPWGTLEKVQESYNIVKLLDPNKPIYCTQNNSSRFAETAEGADIFACDPYPLPNVSLRAVADHTAAAVKAVAGKKPVWTILDQYGEKKPDLQELRCMAYLAVISGANGIGIYAWDDRPDKKTGWYTKEHPEDEKVLRSVIFDLKNLENVLLIPNSDRKIEFFPCNRALHAAIKEVGIKKYLFVASDSRKEEEGELSIEGITDADVISLSNETVQRTIRIKEGKLSLKFPPLGTVLYEIK